MLTNDANGRLRLMHARAQRLLDEALVGVPNDLLDHRTPCADWDLRALLAHILGQNRGLAAALGGAGPELSGWQPIAVGADPAGEIASSSAELVAALSVLAPDATVWMPEISLVAPLPWRAAVHAHLLDSVVHGWDIAAAVGRPYAVPDDLVALALEVAARVPDGPQRLRPGAAFRPSLVPSEQPDGLASLLALLGRDQSRWTGVPAGGSLRPVAPTDRTARPAPLDRPAAGR